MTDKQYDVLVFADACVDLILRDDDVQPQFGQVEKLVEDYALVMGGSGCIFAAQAAKLGLRVAILGRVGTDALGQLIIDELVAAGVDTRYLTTHPQLRTGITVHLAQGEDRAMLTHLGALNALTRADISDPLLASARHLHYGSLYLHSGLLPDWIDILRRARQLGLTTSLDTNWDPAEVWDYDLASGLRYVDVLLPNEQEALHLSGRVGFAAAVAWLRAQVPLLVIKRDAQGAVAWQAKREIRQAVEPAPAGGDGIGAGDSFAAGFLAGWLGGLPLETSLAIGCQCGRGAASAVGGAAGQPLLAAIPALQPSPL
ncbi:MAG: carbohydrate kinase family protein [Chloroflexi bacterium]|nr:carbohydrate kinase family protein [Chloroflexota bacterium]MCY3581261.1 carbohydrate kinase family protein [Chloroflexota bacterium]MCY3716454.1 carbohydrate kinase family protein [Chloroflexota bacterium]MDE2651315.1 carbohydrate kinase family protein [Chloroflexota bacterium]MXX50020.1 carbohydrate kinase family protein [Chloroflexota bacterium]